MHSLYSEDQIKFLREELTSAGFQQITSSDAVKEAICSADYVIYVINSVCCCAANNARPAAIQALNFGRHKGLNIVGVSSFAGVDLEAVAKFRELTDDYAPSSPCIAIFERGKLLLMVERRNIDKSTAEEVFSRLQAVLA